MTVAVGYVQRKLRLEHPERCKVSLLCECGNEMSPPIHPVRTRKGWRAEFTGIKGTATLYRVYNEDGVIVAEMVPRYGPRVIPSTEATAVLDLPDPLVKTSE